MTAHTRRHFIAATTLASLAPTLLAGRANATPATDLDAGRSAANRPVRLNYNESPYGPSSAALAAMKKGAEGSGRYEYEEQLKLIDLFARQNQVPNDHVKAYCGSRQPLQFALAAAASQGSLVLAAPTYDSVAAGARSLGVKVHEVPLDAHHAHDVEAMLAADTAPGLIYLCNPNNPTGTLTPQAAIRHLVEHKPAGCLAVIDEAYIHFSDAPSCLELAVQHEDVLVLRTFSKLYGMAGARLGLAVGRPALLARLEACNGHNYIPLPTALGGIASLQDTRLVAERKAVNAHVLNATLGRLRQAGFTCTQAQANCFMVQIGQPVAQVIDALAQQGVLVGRPFPAWPTWLRVSVGTAEQMQRFVNTLLSLFPHAPSLV